MVCQELADAQENANQLGTVLQTKRGLKVTAKAMVGNLATEAVDWEAEIRCLKGEVSGKILSPRVALSFLGVVLGFFDASGVRPGQVLVTV